MYDITQDGTLPRRIIIMILWDDAMTFYSSYIHNSLPEECEPIIKSCNFGQIFSLLAGAL